MVWLSAGSAKVGTQLKAFLWRLICHRSAMFVRLVAESHDSSLRWNIVAFVVPHIATSMCVSCSFSPFFYRAFTSFFFILHISILFYFAYTFRVFLFFSFFAHFGLHISATVRSANSQKLVTSWTNASSSCSAGSIWILVHNLYIWNYWQLALAVRVNKRKKNPQKWRILLALV